MSSVFYLAHFAFVYSLWVFGYAFKTFWEKRPLSLWAPERIQFFIAHLVWGIGCFLCGLIYYIPRLRTTAGLVFGIGWLFLTVAPCSIKIVNQVKLLKTGRNMAFVVIGIAFFLYAFGIIF